MPGRYVAAWPVFIVADDPRALAFSVDVEGVQGAWPQPEGETSTLAGEAPIARRYARRMTQVRLHQSAFRDRVLRAYREQCAICHLRHAMLLDAAHILPDKDSLGEPRVSNGITLQAPPRCVRRTHPRHPAGIRPDLVVEISQPVLEEHDGPMLRHGLQGVHGQSVWTPRRPEWRPDGAALEQRYEEFRASA